MLKKAIIIGIGAFLATNLWADFATDYQAAVKLYNEQKNEESIKAFEKLAKAAPTPKSKAECLSYAAKALGRDKTKYDAAIETAKKIEIKPISVNTQMSIMQSNGKLMESFDAFKDEDFSTWPEADQLQGYAMRGYVGQILAQNDAARNDAAKKDLLKAIELSGSDLQTKIYAMGNLNDLYFQTKDYDNVISTSKQIFEMKQFNGFCSYLMAAIICASTQLIQGKPEEALETIKLIDHMKEGVYRCQALVVYGDIYAAQGKKDEAAAKYREAAGMTGQSEVVNGIPALAQKKLDALK